MIYRMRIILDATKDVFRDIEVEASSSLEDLHNIIVQSFSLPGEEMASFYETDEEWRQQNEIPLFNMDEGSETMAEKEISDVLDEDDNHLIYVYDFLNMWTFLIELVDTITTNDGTAYPRVLYSMGELPDSPPEKKFEGEDMKEFYQEEDDDEDLYGNDDMFVDDADLDNY